MSASRAAEVTAVVDALAGGEPVTEPMVAVLSDLDRDGAQRVAARWETIPDLARAEVMAFAVSLVTDHIDLNFTRLALVALNDPSSTVREISTAALGDSGGREVAGRLASLIETDDDPEVLAAAAMAATPYVLDFELGHLDAATGEQLVANLRDRLDRGDGLAPETYAAIIEAVGPVSAPWVEDVIRDAYYNDDRGVRLAAVTAMGQTADDEWLDFLDEQLQSDDAEFRRRAAEAVGIIASQDAVEMLVPLLDDEDKTVVAAALVAFAEIGGPEAVAYLQAFEDRVPEELEDVLEDAVESARTGIVLMRPVEEV